MGDVVVGTCSWTDKTMVQAWYPDGVSSAEARLRYYAERFDAVEVDSAFYAIPRREYAKAWARRTPPGFVFHVKAYGMMTGHEVDERTLPAELRETGYDYVVTRRGRVRNPEERMVERAFDLFREAIDPLVEAGKMGGVLLQYPPWFTAEDREHRDHNLAHIEQAVALLDPLPVFVEFRHASWAEPPHLEQTMRFLADRGLTFVSVDAPQVASKTAMPPVIGTTAALGYVRFHGRNHGTWDAKTSTAAERFDYLYTRDELAEWRAPIEHLAAHTDRTWTMFNNCHYDYAPRNASELASILGPLVAPRGAGAPTGAPASADHPGTDRPPSGQLDMGF